jgi:hypothetical protein
MAAAWHHSRAVWQRPTRHIANASGVLCLRVGDVQGDFIAMSPPTILSLLSNFTLQLVDRCSPVLHKKTSLSCGWCPSKLYEDCARHPRTSETTSILQIEAHPHRPTMTTR